MPLLVALLCLYLDWGDFNLFLVLWNNMILMQVIKEYKWQITKGTLVAQAIRKYVPCGIIK